MLCLVVDQDGFNERQQVRVPGVLKGFGVAHGVDEADTAVGAENVVAAATIAANRYPPVGGPGREQRKD